MKRVFPLLLLLAAALGCVWTETIESTQIPQSEIAQIYRVSADRNETRIAAVFNHGGWGRTVDLDAPSRIEHNGREMPQISPNFFKGTTYEIAADRFDGRHEFVYTNGEGEVYRNRMSFEAIEIVADGEIRLSRTQSTVVRLSRPVAAEERMQITLGSLEPRPQATPDGETAGNSRPADFAQKHVYDLSLTDELSPDRTSISLKPKDLKKFARGKAVLKIEVGRELPLQQSNAAGGSMNWSYVSSVGATVED